jgi:hypothetical protein
MAKLKLDNGNVLRIKAVKGDKGAVDIIVWDDGAHEGDYWRIGAIQTNGILRVSGSLRGNIADGLQYEAYDGGIKVERN